MSQESIFAGLTLVAAPAVEPLSLADAKQHLNVSIADDDAYITLLITLARQHCQAITRRAFISQTWKLLLKTWPGRNDSSGPDATIMTSLDQFRRYNYIQLPYAPLVSVASVIYYDTDNHPFTMTQGNVSNGYNVQTDFEPGRIVLPFSQIWPTTILLPGAPIVITYTCGFADVATFLASCEYSALIVHAMKLLIGGWYEYRLEEPIDTGNFTAVDRLLMAARIYE